MRDKVLAWCREMELFSPGDSVICAVSGGADSIAMLWCLHSCQEKLGIAVSAAHFNHHLRGAESQRDEDFVRDFCRGFGIPLQVGGGEVLPGKRGLEAAAREARYAFLFGLDPKAKIATAHTADDNAETLLMHLIRGTALDGLGGIPPCRGRIVRPVLPVTRQEILKYLEDLGLPHVEDSSNGEDCFLRNRLRHYIVPALAAENPSFVKNITAMAVRLRQDGDFLQQEARSALERAREGGCLSCKALKALHPAVLSRVLGQFLREAGVKEPEASHIDQALALVVSENPSAYHDFPCGVRLRRVYDGLTAERAKAEGFSPVELRVPGVTELPELGLMLECRIITAPAAGKSTKDTFLLALDAVEFPVLVRPRLAQDKLSRPGGTKTVKALFIDRKIPSAERNRIPVLADGRGVLGVYTLGPDHSRISKAGAPALCISITKIERGR